MKKVTMSKIETIYDSAKSEMGQRPESGLTALLANGYEEDMKDLYCQVTDEDWQMKTNEDKRSNKFKRR